MNIPEIKDLLYTLETLLQGFNPTTLIYLDNQGKWRRNPSTLRERISNELWYRIWETKRNKNYSVQIKGTFYPFIQDENSWSITNKIFHRICAESYGKINQLLIIIEVIYWLIEYNAYKRNSEEYIADWDSKGKARKIQYLKKTEKFLNDLKQILNTKSQIDTFFKMMQLLKADDKSIFNRVSLIIAEEEKLIQHTKDLLTDIRDSEKRDEIYDFLSEHISQVIGMTTEVQQALLRPCLELLTNPDIDVSSGIQYEASVILGFLKDLRSIDTLLNALENCELKYTNLRCNLIYAIGNLKQKKAVNHLINVLESPDSVEVHTSSSGLAYNQPLDWEKREAIWALGKLGSDAIDALPTLIRYSNSQDREMKISLAWAMGMIGSGQKEKYGGIDAGVLITLMNSLTAKDSEIFEESAFALRKLDLPDFLHTLYIHNFSTIPILSLKPSSTGLYELSETILHLISIKKPVVMAVTGDSGTGKTYFCEAIANGFSGLRKNEILYLMRDKPTNKIFNRMLGLKWLKEHIDPQYYEDYSLSQDEDNPDEFFDKFIKEHSNKKLIILDGWRDKVYFHQVIGIFYEKGYLDIIVKFQTTFSTRRINLEEREGSLERVNAHLPLVEEPVIEKTKFYREGAVLIYNLDNSISSRFNREEILEIFQRKKINTWADQIRIGRFEKDTKPLRIHSETLSSHWEEISVEIEPISSEEVSIFTPSEASFSRILNDNITQEPNLIQVIKLNNILINRIAFYTHGQIAYCGYDGSVGILTGLDDHIFYTNTHRKKVVGLAIVGENICSIDTDGELKITSFYKNTITSLGTSNSSPCSIASDRASQIIIGHSDGTIRILDIQSKQVKILKGNGSAVLSMAIDRYGRIYSGSDDGELRVWDIGNNRVKIFKGHKTPISTIGINPDGRIVTGTKVSDDFKKGEHIRGAEIRIIDSKTDICKTFHICDIGVINAINVYFDGRIIAGIKTQENQSSGCNLIIADPRLDFCQYKILTGHRIETRDCITMGPRIITCGSDSNLEHTLRIWGTEFYVKIEHEKLKLMSDTTVKPPYHRMLF